MSLKLMIMKEFRALFREPIVIVMIVMPFIIYGGMAPFYRGAVEQAVTAAKLHGVKIAVAGCGAESFAAARVIAERLSAENVTAKAVETCEPVSLLKEYDVVFYLSRETIQQIVTGNATIEVYVRGEMSKLMKTLSLPSAAFSRLTEAMRGRANVTMKAYIYLGGRLWSYGDLNNLYGFATTLSYATFFILFPAASIGAALIGAEREERVLEVLFSLPIRRRDIAIAKALAAITAAVLTAVSALAGLYMLMVKGLSASIGVNISSYYGVAGLAAYIAALGLEALFVASLAMIVGLFTTSIRGAQSASMVAVFPALIPPFLLISGVPVSYATAVIPYMAAVLSSLYPLLSGSIVLTSIAAQALETLVVLAVLVKMLESEIAITGPETVKRLFRKLRERRGRLSGFRGSGLLGLGRSSR